MTPALPHRWRLYAILALAILDIAALVATHLGVADALLVELRPPIELALLVALVLLFPASADAIMVELRRRNPAISALPDDVRDTRQHRRPSSLDSGGLALVLVVLAATLSVATSGCGATAIEVHAPIADGLQTAARETRIAVRAYRTGRMRAAALAVREAGGDVDAAIAAMESAGAAPDVAGLVEAQRVYASASFTYLRAVRAGLRSANGLDFGDIADALEPLADTYRHLRRLGTAAGIELLARMPATPDFLDSVLPPQLLAARASSEGASR